MIIFLHYVCATDMKCAALTGTGTAIYEHSESPVDGEVPTGTNFTATCEDFTTHALVDPLDRNDAFLELQSTTCSNETIWPNENLTHYDCVPSK